jgi:hypothetical protein
MNIQLLLPYPLLHLAPPPLLEVPPPHLLPLLLHPLHHQHPPPPLHFPPSSVFLHPHFLSIKTKARIQKKNKIKYTDLPYLLLIT